MEKKGTKISIIGCGFVGSTTAFSIIERGIASELILVDIDKEKAFGEQQDLSHGLALCKPYKIIAGDYEDTKDSDIIIITAGVGQKEGETRLDLVHKNYKVFQSFVPKIAALSPNSILLVVSNPVDILTYITYKLSGFPKERVIGSGTALDTSRLKYLISDYLDVDSRNIHSYILGEHGDSEIAAWSNTSIGGIPIKEYCKQRNLDWNEDIEKELHYKVKNAAYEIIKRKKATYYAVAIAVRRICESIIRNEKSIITVSTLLEGEYGINDIYLGVPSKIGSNGVEYVLETTLNQKESELLINSAEVLKDLLKNIK